MSTPFTSMYVSHDVALPVHDLSVAMDEMPARTACGGVTLTFDGADVRRHPRRPCDPWRSRSALLRAGRLRPSFRVSMEAVPWSSARSQIGIRPQSRACSIWPSSYFDAAHTIAAHVSATSSATVTSSNPVAASGELACRVHDVAFDDGDDIALVKIAGDLRAENRDQLHQEVREPIESRARRVLVDLTGVRTVDLSGIATLAALTRVATRECSDSALMLTAVPRPVRDEIEDSGYAPLLKIA